MKILSFLAFSTGTKAQYGYPLFCAIQSSRCDYECSTIIRESCYGGYYDLACCTENEACGLVNAKRLDCTDLPYLDNLGAARSYFCCVELDSDIDSDTDDNFDEDTSAGNSTEATDRSTRISLTVLTLLRARVL